MNNKTKTLLNNIIVFAIGNLGSKLVLFFLVPLYTNFLSTEEYGTVDLVFTVSQLLYPVFSLVIYNSLFRFGLSKDEKKENVLLAGTIVIVLGIALSFLTIPLLNFYEPIAPWKWYLILYINLFNLNLFNSFYLKVKNKNKQYAIISVIQTIVLALLNVLFLTILHLNIEGYLLANIISCFVAFLISFYVSGIIRDLKRAKLDLRLLKQMIFYSTPLILNEISWWVIHSSDKIMIEWMIGVSALGIYTVATKIPSLINVLVSIFSQAWGISSIQEYENEHNYDFFGKVFNFFTITVFAFSISVCLVIKWFMKVYVSDAFYSAWTLVPFLVVASSFAAISSYYGAIYGAIKKSLNSMLTTLFGAIINIIVNFSLISTIGMVGAAIGTMIAYIVITLARMIDANRFLKIPINYGKFVINCLLALVASLVAYYDFYILILCPIFLIALLLVNYKEIRFFAHNMLRKKSNI